MKRVLTIALMILSISFISSCGNTDKKDTSLAGKKSQLEKLKTQKDDLDNKIETLQKEIAKMDTSASEVKPKLVSLSPINTVDFKHYLTLQGSVDDKNISYGVN